MTNAELGKRIHSGDESAFATFFDRHYGWVYRRALKFLKSHEDAEDTASVVFMKLWKNREKHNTKRGSFQAWFNVLCQNTIIDAARQQQLDYAHSRHGDLQVQDDLSLLEHIPDTRKGALDTLISEETLRRVEDALCEVESPYHRLAWTLHHLEGYKYREVGRIMRRAEGTCKVWGYRCNQHLREALTHA